MTDPLQWASARETRAQITAGRTSAVAVAAACLARIERLNPTLNAFTHVDREGAMAAARRADAALADGCEAGPLHGVPVAIKDDLWVAGMPATCGSLVFANFRPSFDGNGVEDWLARGSARGELCFTAPEFIELVSRHGDLLSPPQQCLGRVSLDGAEIPSPKALNTLMDELFASHDVICSPTMATVAPVAPAGWASAYGDSFMGTHFTFIANATSCPAISIPCGLVDGLPVGLQILGRRGEEAMVLRVARALERVLPPLPPPPQLY